MIILPLLGLVGVGGYVLFGPEGHEETRPGKNERLTNLTRQVAQFEREANEVIRVIRSEGPDAKSRPEAFLKELTAWLEEWEGVTRDLHDAQGGWKPGYEGYGEYVRTVGRLRYDILKIKGF